MNNKSDMEAHWWMEGIPLWQVVREGLLEKMTFEQSNDG